MFDIGWSELVVIGVVALIVIGPKELPAVLRSVGQWTGKIRRMAADFQGQFHEAMREIEMADLKKQVDEATSGLDTKFDPFDLNSASSKTGSDTPSTSPSTSMPPSSAGIEAAKPPSGTPEPPAVTECPPQPMEGAAAAESPASAGEGSRPA